MAGAQSGRVSEDDATAEQRDRPAALRIDTDVFVALSETSADGDGPVIERWLDCWRP